MVMNILQIYMICLGNATIKILWRDNAAWLVLNFIFNRIHKIFTQFDICFDFGLGVLAVMANWYGYVLYYWGLSRNSNSEQGPVK